MGLKQGLNQSIGGINRGLNQFLSPFDLSLPTHQDRPLQAMREGADVELRHAGLPPLKDLATIPFSDSRRERADVILHAYLSQNHLYGARAKLDSGQDRRLDHWTDLLSKPELQQFINGMEKALLPKAAVALSGMNDPKGRTVQVPKDEAFKQIGAIKQEVQDYFRGVWPPEAKSLLGILDALQSYTIDQRVDALRTELSQSGWPIDKIISMGIGWIRTTNPLAVINSLHTLDQEIARTGSTKPFEQALQAIGLQFTNLAGVGKDLVVLLAKRDMKGAQALLKKHYDLSTLEGQDRATGAINTILSVYGGAQLTRAGLKKLGLLNKPGQRALVPINQTPQKVQPVVSITGPLQQLQRLTAEVDEAIQIGNPATLKVLQTQIKDTLGNVRELAQKQKEFLRSEPFKSRNIAAERALVKLQEALKKTNPPSPTVPKTTVPRNNIVPFNSPRDLKTISPDKDFSGENLAGANLRRANLERAKLRNLRGASLQEANLRLADLRLAILQEANLQGANLQRAGLQFANLEKANLQEADLRLADLKQANLQGANLQGANLQGANLQEVNLRFANLQGANLQGANLQGVDFRELNLTGTDLRGANLTGAIYDQYTKWPEGFSPETMGAKKKNS